jgi:halimadienyl-diphosphate synthase
MRSTLDIGSILDPETTSDMGHSEYDAAWIARVKDPHTKAPMFPDVLEIVRSTQSSDGGWAGDVEYPPARILATLSSILAITDYDPPGAPSLAVLAGAEFVSHTFDRVHSSQELTIGFELVAPTLIREACESGLKLKGLLPVADLLRQEKRKRLPDAMIYEPSSSASFSLEFLGEDLDPDRAQRLVLSDGSVGASVAATAYYAMHTCDERALRHLRCVVDAFGPANIPYAWPVTIWPGMWALKHFRIGGVPLSVGKEQRFLDLIASSFNTNGVTWCERLPYADSDDTSMALHLLGERASAAQWALLDGFEVSTGFLGFLGERGPSVSANAHVLMALVGGFHPDAARMARKAAAFLLDNRHAEGAWFDKWHASPLYPTSRAVMALLKHDSAEHVEVSIRWLLANQRSDGSWGYYRHGTAEETAYAVCALASYYEKRPSAAVFQAIGNAGSFLGQFDGTEPREVHPKLWITKVLYRPLAVIRSAILAARALAERARLQMGPS